MHQVELHRELVKKRAEERLDGGHRDAWILVAYSLNQTTDLDNIGGTQSHLGSDMPDLMNPEPHVIVRVLGRYGAQQAEEST